jgi:hypothetical protein
MVNTSSGQQNVAVGASNLFANTMGSYHTAVGRDSLRLSRSTLLTVTITNGGSGYTDGTYTAVNLQITGGTATPSGFSNPQATIVVSGGVVTTVTVTGGGGTIDSTMIFGVDPAAVGGTGSGFSATGATFSTPERNTALGYRSGRGCTDGSRNVFLGNQAGENETTSDNLYISNSSTSTPLIKGKFDSTGANGGSVRIYGDLQLTTKTPATAAATGTAGTITYDADYIYICTATDTWKRVAISTW